MRKASYILISFLILSYSNIFGQYTESINSYHPGSSQGAFSVGKHVYQLEFDLGLGGEKNDIFENKTRTNTYDYTLRAGVYKEQLEVILQGTYAFHGALETIGIQTKRYWKSGFQRSLLGAKYLIYDPYKYEKAPERNLLSWEANKKFNWRKLVPAVALYAGASFTGKNNNFAHHNISSNRASRYEPFISPKVVLSLQNNWTKRLVFVANASYADITTEFPDLRFIFTTSYKLLENLSVLGEYEWTHSQIYKDHIFKLGTTYFYSDNLQFHGNFEKNIKNTPSIWSANLGVALRIDKHQMSDFEKIKTGEQRAAEKDIARLKKDIAAGLIDESALTGTYKGLNLEDYRDTADEEIIADVENDSTAVKKRKKGWFSFLKRKKKKVEVLAEQDSLKQGSDQEVIFAKKGRITDFMDDEFIAEKMHELEKQKRTTKELDSLSQQRKLNTTDRKITKIDSVTGKTVRVLNPYYVSKKQLKAEKKQAKELAELEAEINNLEAEIKTEQTEREARRKRKKQEKEAAKAEKKAQKELEKLEKELGISPEDSVEAAIKKEEKTPSLKEIDKKKKKERKRRKKEEKEPLVTEIEKPLEEKTSLKEIEKKKKKKEKKRKKEIKKIQKKLKKTEKELLDTKIDKTLEENTKQELDKTESLLEKNNSKNTQELTSKQTVKESDIKNIEMEKEVTIPIKEIVEDTPKVIDDEEAEVLKRLNIEKEISEIKEELNSNSDNKTETENNINTPVNNSIKETLVEKLEEEIIDQPSSVVEPLKEEIKTLSEKELKKLEKKKQKEAKKAAKKAKKELEKIEEEINNIEE